MATSKESFRHFARVLIDLDLNAKLRNQILVERENVFFVSVEYEKLPEFCTLCQSIGDHSLVNFLRTNGKTEKKAIQEAAVKQRKIYVPKSKVEDSRKATEEAIREIRDPILQEEGAMNVHNISLENVNKNDVPNDNDNDRRIHHSGSVIPVFHQNIISLKGKEVLIANQSTLQQGADGAGCSHVHNSMQLDLDQNPSAHRMNRVYGPDMVIEADPSYGPGRRADLMALNYENRNIDMHPQIEMMIQIQLK